MIKAIIIDFDGTTLPRQWHSVSKENREALEKAGKKGIIRILATGRSFFSFNHVLPEGLPIDYMVFSSGAGIMQWDNRRIMQSRELTVKETREIASYLWKYNVNFTIQKRIPNNHFFLYRHIARQHEDFRRRIENYPGLGTPMPLPEDLNEGATQFLTILGADQADLHEKIQQQLSSYSVIRATSPIDNRAIWTEIFAKDVNKGSSCELLLNRLGISFPECAGLGNDYNDLDFLERCGISFVVANAPAPLTKRVEKVPADTDNGLAAFIYQNINL